MFSFLEYAGTLDTHASHGHTFQTDDSLYAAYGQVDGLQAAMKSLNPIANAAGGPILAKGESLVGWVGKFKRHPLPFLPYLVRTILRLCMHACAGGGECSPSRLYLLSHPACLPASGAAAPTCSRSGQQSGISAPYLSR